MDGKLQLLRDRYYLAASPLALLIGVGTGTPLRWIAAVLLLALTANKLAPHIK
jgi:hypothetical protein